MTKLEKIEQDISSLSKAELFKLADWFATFHADAWDKQMVADVDAGRLDTLAAQALADHKARRTTLL